MKARDLWKTVIALFASLIHFLPFYIVFTVAFKAKTDLSSRWAFPKELYLDNFKLAIEKAHVMLAIRNSIIITVITIVLVMIIGAMAAYPLSRIKSNFNKIILLVVVGIMMVPPLSVLVPLLAMLSKFNLISTYAGIILVLLTFQLPMSIFLYSNFIGTIPISLDESATIDGCNKVQTFFHVILPLLKPVTASVVILTGVNIWNDYQFSLYLLQAPEKRVVTLAVSTFFAQSSSNLGAAAASALIAILPIAILYIFLQKYFVQGMVDGAVKG